MIKFDDGNYFVNRDIQPGTYTIGSNAGAAACEWERLANLQGTGDQIIESGGWRDGLRVTVADSDIAFYTSGCGIWRSASNP